MVDADIGANLARVRERIVDACARVGRNPSDVRLIAVSKTVSAERVRVAFDAGLSDLGENKVQEALSKHEALADLPLRWNIIGHLQTNKAKFVARFAHEFQALDSLRVAEALERRLSIEHRSLDVFVQVNTSGEASKFGLEPKDVPGFIEALAPFERLRPRGLMTLAIFSDDLARVRACFRRLRTLRDEAQARGRETIAELSMGMSGDFETAIEEGANIIRVGQAIFGPRQLPDSHYWPDAG